MAKYLGVAAEVSWSQSWASKEGLEKKMGELMEVEGGTTRAVIGVLLRTSTSGTLKMFLSFWRYATPHGSDRVWDCVPIVPGNKRSRRLTLGDFISPDAYAKYFPGADLDTEILIPLGDVYGSAQRGFALWQLEGNQ